MVNRALIGSPLAAVRLDQGGKRPPGQARRPGGLPRPVAAYGACLSLTPGPSPFSANVADFGLDLLGRKGFTLKKCTGDPLYLRPP